MREKVWKFVKGLPTAHFSFPLERLLELDGPPSEALALVSEICDRLIQERLNTACRKILCDLETPSALKSDLPAGWDATPRKEGGPIHLVKSVFIALENERKRFHTEAERAELEVRSLSWPSPKQFLAKIEEAWKAHQFRYGSVRSKMLVDGLPWLIMRNKAWTERAALLPTLSPHKDVIAKWVNAGLFWIIAQHDGTLDDVKWTDSINRRITSKESLLGALHRFLTEGFETLAGKGRKGEHP